MAMQILAGSDPVLIVDDDAFLPSRPIVERGLAQLAGDERAVAYTFHCRDWWQLPAAGSLHVPMDRMHCWSSPTSFDARN